MLTLRLVDVGTQEFARLPSATSVQQDGRHFVQECRPSSAIGQGQVTSISKGLVLGAIGLAMSTAMILPLIL